MCDETPKLCRVCGDKALGKNFCAISCESCKAFFRRNASNIDKMKCYYGEKCEINVEMRTVCRKCRLRKCFAIGMKKEWILNENEKELRKQKILKNKQKLVNSDNKNDKIIESMTKSISNTSSTMKLSNDIISDGLLSSESTEIDFIFDLLDKHSLSDEKINSQIREIESSLSNDSINDLNDISQEVYRKTLELEMAVIPIARPFNTNSFNETESFRFSELIDITNELRKPQASPTAVVSDFTNAALILVQKCDEEFRNVVKVYKKLNAFKGMCESDKITLFKYGTVKVVVMHAVACYDGNNDHWSIPVDTNNSALMDLKILKQSKNDLYFPLQRFLHELSKEYDNDEIILELLSAIALFEPTLPDLKHREAIRLHQLIYMYLLQRYLQVKYGGSECMAKTKFIRLMNGVIYAHRTHHTHLRYLLEEVPTLDISPLLSEIHLQFLIYIFLEIPVIVTIHWHHNDRSITNYHIKPSIHSN
ncbi:nuclear hormone receptor HR96-like [Oppia nitens]|uniref:nuclear hormone receptor HR96-like n=1 Tax=Oppia nitens TaxID=1686743 RepID=UPI0023DAAD25|nr:nuclear hormone receptor HR96-like [Oppia nitens]